MRRSRKLRDALAGAAGVAAIVAAWQAALAAGLVSARSLPPPLEVVRRMAELLADGAFYAELGDTLLTWALALGLTFAVAVPLGLLVGWVAVLYHPTAGLVHMLRSIPPTALIPVAILAFGLGIEMKLAVVCYAIAWPLLLNTAYGVHAVDPLMVAAARSLRWNRRRLFGQLILPAAAQYIGTGVRLAGSIGFVVVLSAELLGARRGVGTLIVRYQQVELPAFVYAGIVIVGICGMTIYYLLLDLERRLSPWAPGNRPA